MSRALEILADLKRSNDRVGVHLECAQTAMDSALHLLSGLSASGTLTEGGDAKQAPGDSLSGPTAESGDAQALQP